MSEKEELEKSENETERVIEKNESENKREIEEIKIENKRENEIVEREKDWAKRREKNKWLWKREWVGKSIMF